MGGEIREGVEMEVRRLRERWRWGDWRRREGGEWVGVGQRGSGWSRSGCGGGGWERGGERV